MTWKSGRHPTNSQAKCALCCSSHPKREREREREREGSEIGHILHRERERERESESEIASENECKRTSESERR